MGTLWAANASEAWDSTTNPRVATSTGYKLGRYIWRHNGTTWVQVWQRDTTPPNAPVVTLSLVSGTKNVVRVNVANGSAGPIKRTVVKVNWKGVNPQNPEVKDADYRAQTYNGEEWSEYWKGRSNAANLSGAKPIPASYQTFTIPLSTTVRVAAWAMDDYFNWSAAGRDTITTLAPDPPAPTLKQVSATLTCNDAGQWSTNNGIWTTSGTQNGYAGQGGNYALEGYWFFNGRVKSTLSKMVSGLESRVFMYRVNSAHGVSGAALIRPGVHRAVSKPANGPGIAGLHGSGINLARGQGGWYSFPTGWFGEMKGGTITGVAIGGVGYTSYTSNAYAICYGRGTTGGQWYMRWNQY